MRLRFRPTNTTPIAIDLGYTSTKLLQVVDGCIEAADELPIPFEAGEDIAIRLEALGETLGPALSDGPFRGRRVIVAMPAFATVLQAMQFDAQDATDDALAMQLRLPATTDPYMVRPIEVPVANGSRREVICQAMPRSAVLRHVELLHRLKLDVVGVLAQPRPMVAAFDHINRRMADASQSTMYVDLGYSGTTAVLAHGHDIVLARSIPIGGRHFDDCIATAMHFDRPAAQQHRLALQHAAQSPPPSVPATGVPMIDAIGQESPSPTLIETDRRDGQLTPTLGQRLQGAPGLSEQVDFSELIDTLVDELRLCLRHHAAAWPQNEVARVIFTGGEARQEWLCRQVVQALHLPGQVGDPLARLSCADGATSLIDWANRCRPDWSLAAGLVALAQGGSRHVA
jgi:Tfp pilus assembly PilM family ATPase